MFISALELIFAVAGGVLDNWPGEPPSPIPIPNPTPPTPLSRLACPWLGEVNTCWACCVNVMTLLGLLFIATGTGAVLVAPEPTLSFRRCRGCVICVCTSSSSSSCIRLCLNGSGSSSSSNDGGGARGVARWGNEGFVGTPKWDRGERCGPVVGCR
mgnify:CR=1 FL=1